MRESFEETLLGGVILSVCAECFCPQCPATPQCGGYFPSRQCQRIPINNGFSQRGEVEFRRKLAGMKRRVSAIEMILTLAINPHVRVV